MLARPALPRSAAAKVTRAHREPPNAFHGGDAKFSSMQHLHALGLALVLVACGGRTMLGDLSSDGGTLAVDGGTPIGDGGVIDDGGVVVVDGGGPGGAISCGQTTCNASSQVCCVTFSGQTPNEACVDVGQCQNGVSLTCTSALACPHGEVCCASFTQTSAGSQCEPSCPTGPGEAQLCASSAECTGGRKCRVGFGGLHVCRY